MMTKITALTVAFGLLIPVLFVQPCSAGIKCYSMHHSKTMGEEQQVVRDTLVPAEVLDIVTAVIKASSSFNLQSVADLYTPNAVIADDEAPYSWAGPTAGIQWVNAVEKACKINGITKLTAEILPVNVFQQSNEDVYVVVPVSYTGNQPGKQHFAVKGAFTFILREVNGRWLIKSQAWMQEKAM